uniref:Uncharacterized protein n=1 Tax=Fagus sylvatica TaxID=28930 RepID=A0A2N9GUH7_FAGSY
MFTRLVPPHFRSPDRGLPSLDLRNLHHHGTPLRPIYHLVVEPPPSDVARAPHADGNSGISVHAPPRLANSITESSELRFMKEAPPSEFTTSDLSSAAKIALIRACTCLHAPMRCWQLSPRAPIRPARVMHAWHAPARGWHTPSATYLSTVLPRQHATSTKKKKRKGKFW